MPEEDTELEDIFASLVVNEPPPPAPAAPTAPASSDDDAEALMLMEAAAAAPAPTIQATGDTDTDDAAEFMNAIGLKPERTVPDITKPWMKYHKFELVQSLEQVTEVVDAAIASGRCSLDLETEGLDNRIEYDANGNPQTVHKIVGYCISHDGITGYYIPVRHAPNDGGPDLNVKPLDAVEAEIRRLCVASQPLPAPGALEKDPLSFKDFAEPPKLVIFFWNAKFDQEFLYPVTGIDWWHPDSFEDGLLAFFCNYSADKSLGLKYKSAERLRDQDGNSYIMIELKELFPRTREIKFASLSPDEPGVIKYACSDAICTFLLCEPPRAHEKDRIDVIKLAKSKYGFTYRVEKQTTQVVRVMERNRAQIDRSVVDALLKVHQDEKARLFNEIVAFARQHGRSGLDPSSPAQLAEFLFGEEQNCLNITPKPEKTENGQYKTGGDVLEEMVKNNPHAPPILQWVVDYRAVEKVLGTYLLSMSNNTDKLDQLRFNFKQTGTGTGRFSAPAQEAEQGFSGVPIHGIPATSSVRKAFWARLGYSMAKCDYAGQELRIAANVSGEPLWVTEFLEGDGDLHTLTAMAFFNKDKKSVTKDERKGGKIANFSLIYGGGPAAVMRATGCDKLEASRRKQAFDKSVPKFATWIKNQHAIVKKDLGVWTPFKRWLAIPDANHPDKAVAAACERYSTNYPIQGSGADIMKISMVLLHKEFHRKGWLKNGGDDSVRMLLTVHDEIVFEIRHDRVVEVIPIIVKLMESPTFMASPAWKVPLVVEPLIGPNWGSGYKCEKPKPGYVPKADEILVNGFVYGTVRKAEKGDLPGAGEVLETDKDGKQVIRIVDPAWLRGVKTDGPPTEATPPTEDPGGEAPEAPGTPPAAPVARPAVTATLPSPSLPTTPVTPIPPPSKVPTKSTKPVTLRINRLNALTVEQVANACFNSPGDRVLHLQWTEGSTLIDPSFGILVDPAKLAAKLFELNLGDGEYS